MVREWHDCVLSRPLLYTVVIKIILMFRLNKSWLAVLWLIYGYIFITVIRPSAPTSVYNMAADSELCYHCSWNLNERISPGNVMAVMCVCVCVFCYRRIFMNCIVIVTAIQVRCECWCFGRHISHSQSVL